MEAKSSAPVGTVAFASQNKEAKSSAPVRTVAFASQTRRIYV